MREGGRRRGRERGKGERGAQWVLSVGCRTCITLAEEKASRPLVGSSATSSCERGGE